MQLITLLLTFDHTDDNFCLKKEPAEFAELHAN